MHTWSDDHMCTWSDDHMHTWLDDHMHTWSDDYMGTWSDDHMHTWYTCIWRGKWQVDACIQKALQPGAMLAALMQAAVKAALSCCSGSSHAARCYNATAGSNDVAS